MARTPSSVGFQPRTTPAERRADLDLRRIVAEMQVLIDAQRAEIDQLRTDVDSLLP